MLTSINAELLASRNLPQDASTMGQDTLTRSYEQFGSTRAPLSIYGTRLAPGAGVIQPQDSSNDQDAHYSLRSTTQELAPPASSNWLVALPDVSTASPPLYPSRHNFECSVCSKRFSRSGRADSCKNSHTGAKPYACRGKCGSESWWV